MSRTLSRKRTAIGMMLASRSKSMRRCLLDPTTNRARLIDPRVQDSYGSKGCSAQGFVASMRPICGVGFRSFIVSRNRTPGSPVLQAAPTRRSKTAAAFRLATGCPVRGLISL